MKKEFTATVYIIKENKFLMIFHPKHKKWLPPGGHVETGELPHEAALREALEETGIDVELFSTERITIPDRPNARTIPSPYLMLEQKIPEYKGILEHRHIDLVYVGKPKINQQSIQNKENHEIRWFNLNEILSLKDEIEIFIDTKYIVKELFNLFGSLSPLPQPYLKKENALGQEPSILCPSSSVN